MATVTYVRTIKFVAEVLEEDPELLQAIVSNDDNLSYGNIITVYTGDDESVTALTDDGMEELEQMLSHARRSPDEWSDWTCFGKVERQFQIMRPVSRTVRGLNNQAPNAAAWDCKSHRYNGQWQFRPDFASGRRFSRPALISVS